MESKGRRVVVLGWGPRGKLVGRILVGREARGGMERVYLLDGRLVQWIMRAVGGNTGVKGVR